MSMENKFKVGDKVIIKSVNDILGMYEGDEQEKVSKTINNFNEYFNKIGTIMSYGGGNFCFVNCGPDCACFIPIDWLEKYGSVEHVKNIIKTADEIFAKKHEIVKFPKEIEEVTEEDSLKSEIKEKKVIAEGMSQSEIERSRNTFFSALSDDDIQEVNKKSFDASKNKRVNECLDFYYNIIKSFTVINKTKYKFNPDYLLDFFVSECGFEDYYAKKYIDLYKNCGLKCDDVFFSFSEAKKLFVEVDNIGKICEIANLVIVSEKFSEQNASEKDKELKLLESSNEMYENTKKELESKRCCDSDKKIEGRLEMINNAQKDVISRFMKLINNDNSCNFRFEEGRTDVADSTQSFDCTASTLSDGILCRNDGIMEYFTENERLMSYNFLVELPERYGIPCFNIDEFFIDRNDNTVSMTVYEKEDGSIIRKLISELRFGRSYSEENTNENDISVYHYNNELKIAYKEVFRNIKLEKVVDKILSYGDGDEFFAHYVTFRYATDFIEDNYVVPANASFIIEKHKKIK